MLRSLALLFFLLPLGVFGDEITPQDWYYPMKNVQARSLYKGFGQKIDDAFYRGRERLFPGHFLGYHSGQDFESLPGEEGDEVKVPVYAVADGILLYQGMKPGYGGVILLRLGEGKHVALYGHVKLRPDLHPGDSLRGGEVLTYLGNGFSSETSGERKHLHFGLYKGLEAYFHGHESSLAIVKQKWEDPLEFLRMRGAGDNQ